jgi:hypothetical protein
MSALRILAVAVLLFSLLIGTFRSAEKREPIELGGYRVLAADFHSHMFPGDWALLSPWDVVLDAERNNLDVIALTAHNRTATGQLGAWFGRLHGGILVIPGEEVHTPRFHILGLGVTDTISWRLTAAEVIDAIHRQGGVAVAAHPTKVYWPGYDDRALAHLDAAELVHPEGIRNPASAKEFAQFAERGHFAALGDSDSHGTGPRLCRTYVFVHEYSQAGVLDALRNRRTVIYDHEQWFGDANLIELAKADGRLAQIGLRPKTSIYTIANQIGAAALFLVIVLGLRPGKR